MKYYKSAIDLIGNTPLVELSNLQKKFNLKARVFAKFEALNPSGSVKDRAALYMIKEALASGKINKDTKTSEFKQQLRNNEMYFMLSKALK